MNARSLLGDAAAIAGELLERGLDAVAGEPARPPAPDLIGALSNAELDALELEEPVG